MQRREVAVWARTLKTEDRYGLGTLCFATAMGLVSAIAGVFTNMLPLSVGWRYFWLAVCVACFVLAVIGVVLFSRHPIPKSPTSLLEDENQIRLDYGSNDGPY
jgi:hypothetical protein